MSDRRCRLGLRARLEIAQAVEAGHAQRQVAARFAVAVGTVNAIWQRWRDAELGERERGRCLEPRRPVPKSCPWALSPADEQRVLQARKRTNWGPMRLQALTGRHRSTIHKVLVRHGCSQRRRSLRPNTPARRFEWSQPGALLHIDAFSIAKFDGPGHWATGDRSQANRSRGVGKTVVIGVQDDHSRVVYAELHASENAANVTATLKRAVAWFGEQGAGPVQAVLSDNAKCYATAHEFQRLLAELGARHILCPPYTPRWNGKLERFWQTLDTEWAHSQVWPSSATRDRALASYLRFYNRRRPHSACGGRPPLTRVHQDREQNT